MDIAAVNYGLEKIQLLLVEDDQIDRIAFTRTVQQHNLPYEYTLASSLSEALEILRDRTFQIAILDYNLGDGQSSDLFPILKEQNCPFVISTGSGDEETAARLMSQGAADYLIKDPERNYLKILPATISKTLSRHQIEGQLHLLNRAITSVKDSIYILDNQGKIQYINNTLAEFSNISPQAAIGQPIQVLNQPSLSEWLRSIRSCADENCSTESEIVMCRADGTNFVALVSETCVIEDLHLHRIGVIRNITSLKTVEQELRNSQENLENTVKERTAELQQAIANLQQENQERLKIEASLRASRDQLQQQQEFFKLVIDSNPNLIFVKDWDGRYLLANQPMAEFYNTTVENLVGKTDADFHPNTVDAERFLQENRQIIDTQQEMFLPEERITHAELGCQWLQWQKRPIKIFGNTDSVLGVGVNITTLKEIEISLRESQQLFSSLAAVAPVGIFRTNANGDAIYLNDRWCQIAGLSTAEAAGSNWARALHPDDREKVAAEWYAAVQEHRPFQLECRFQNGDGVTTWVLCQSAAERDSDGEVVGYVGTITDISDRKRAETILQKLVTGTAAVTGADFFVELARHIAEALDVTYALVTECVGDRLVSLAFWANGSLQPSISYLPAKTPCEICMQEGEYHCEEAVQAVFADDLDLVTMQAESYLGIALNDDRGQVIGNLCVLDTKPMSETKKTEAIAILQVFAARASVELQRKNVNEALNCLNQELEIRVHQRTQELQERERFLQTVLDSFPLAVFWKDRQSVLLGCNQLFATTSGVESPLDVIGKTNFDFSYTEEEALKYLEDDRAVIESGLSKIGIEETITLANGQVNWVETNKIPLRNTLGEVVGIVGTFQDITARKVAEATLAESEAFNRQLVTEFPIGLASCRMDGQLIFVNAAFAKILGRTVEETLSLSYWDITPIKYAEQEAEQLRSLQTKGRYGPYEKEYIHKDGYFVPVLLSGLMILQNGESLIWSSVQDISDRKQAQQTILQQANQEILLRGITQRIRQSLDLSIIFDTACQEIQQLLQSDRVGIFKFYPESNFDDGEFVAEAVVNGFSSAMKVPVHDHCFGEDYAAAYTQGRIQVVNDIDNAGLMDCHRDVLAQFQVQANVVIPLLCGNNLWGLLCIHQCTNTRQWQEHEINLIQQIANQLAIAIQQAILYEQLQEELLIRQQSQAKIAQQLRQQQTLETITNKIRESLNIKDILAVVTQQVKDVLSGDRAIVFQLFDNGNSQIVEETVHNDFPKLKDLAWENEVWSQEILNCYWQGKPRIVADVMNDIWTECLVEYSLEGQIKSKIVAPILLEAQISENYRWVEGSKKLWGVLVVHACAEQRQWQESEAQLLQQIANQLAIAIQQASLFEQSQQEIVERKQAQQQLMETNQQLARATRLKDEFLANMSHELRTPLNSILGMNEALQEEIFGSINERQLKALQTIENSSTHLLALINDILDVSKIESGQVTLDLTATNIENLCKSSLSFVKQQALTKRIQLVHKIPEYLPEIMVDERRIRQVLINLLNNAVKFTLEGGSITLEVTQIQSNASATNPTTLNQLRIAVIDTGIGISAENIKKLFQPFIQIDSALNRQYTGTGLGLALVKRIVELHGGSVELTSELGVGSCFAINLPFNVGDPSLEVHTDDVAGQSLLDQSQTDSLISPLILLAEDNEANVGTFSSYLTAKGYRLVFATDGQQAIAIAKAEHPDLILMDIQMPGMDGLEAIKQIRLDPDLADIPIIALTALAMTGDREKCLNAGANEYLSKPVKLRNLDQLIQTLLDK